MAALGVVIAGGLLGVLLWEAASSSTPSPPMLAVEGRRVEAGPSGFLVEFQVRNDGQSAAADVEIEGILRGGGEEQNARVTLDYVPAESSADGGLLFSRDPRGGWLELRASGYTKP